MGNEPRKRKLSWHQKRLRLATIVVITLVLAVFAAVFAGVMYWLNRR